MKEKITIPFYNDLLFKYFVYDNEDEGCQYILKKIIEEITDRKSTRLNSSHTRPSRMPSSA